jgi:hypothetical protein
MMMRPASIRGRQVGFNGLFVPGRVAHHFTAFADALIRLDVCTCGHFLQKDLDWFGTFLALERESAGRFIAHFFLA